MQRLAEEQQTLAVEQPKQAEIRLRNQKTTGMGDKLNSATQVFEMID